MAKSRTETRTLRTATITPEAAGFPLAAQAARLDVSRRDDQCRLRGRNAVWVHGLFARLANSLFLEWRSHQKKPQHKTTTDFAARLAAEHGRRMMLAVTSRRPNLRSPS